MKVAFLISLFVFANGCNSPQATVNSSEKSPQQEAPATISTPKENTKTDGTTMKVHKNSTLVYKDDTTGGIYPVIEAGDFIVVEYTYTEKGPEGTVDGDYSETIQFEIPSNIEKYSLSGKEMQNAKVLFGKQCYCKGEAGFYKVTNGKLSVIGAGNDLIIDLQFKVPETSQKVSSLQRTITK